jgi:2-amino-4-hydroxy-6-hydroxymethyldihydropteridine diphosphokinase
MSQPAPETAYIALGSNLGDSVEIIRLAFTLLQALSDVPLLRSSLWRTNPVDCPPGSPPFVNAMAGLSVRSDETPPSLLHRLQTLEQEFGRQRGPIQNAPRLLDLDLIAFGARTLQLPDLILPHPRAHLRRFVLQPLAEIAPHLILPGQTLTVAALLAGLLSLESLERIN